MARCLTWRSRYFSDIFFHHRASVWGVSISKNYIITGSMDGTIALIDINTMTLKKHFMAHQGEWGGKCKMYFLGNFSQPF